MPGPLDTLGKYNSLPLAKVTQVADRLVQSPQAIRALGRLGRVLLSLDNLPDLWLRNAR